LEEFVALEVAPLVDKWEGGEEANMAEEPVPDPYLLYVF
jgi:hypothetical protein